MSGPWEVFGYNWFATGMSICGANAGNKDEAHDRHESHGSRCNGRTIELLLMII